MIYKNILGPSESSIFSVTQHLTVISAAEPNTCSSHSGTMLDGSSFEVTRAQKHWCFLTWPRRKRCWRSQTDRFSEAGTSGALGEVDLPSCISAGVCEGRGARHSSRQKFCWHELLVKIYKTSAEQKGVSSLPAIHRNAYKVTYQTHSNVALD